MGSYDFFQAQPGPNIDINLFGNAATQGAALGKAIPSPITSVVEGYKEGLDIQAKQEQIERERLQNEVLALDTQVKLDNKDLYLQTKKSELLAADAENKQKLNDFKLKDAIAQDLNDPSRQQAILDNPEYSEFLIRNPKEAEYVIGSLSSKGILNEDQQLNALKRIDLVKALQLKALQDKTEQGNLGKYLEEKEKARDKVKNDGLLGGILPGFEDEDAAKIEVYPHGVKTFDKITGMINDTVPDKKAVVGGAYKFDLAIGGKLSSSSASVTDTDATSIRTWKDSNARLQRQLERTYGIKTKPTEASAATGAVNQPAAPEAKPEPAFQTFDQIANKTAERFEDRGSVVSILGEAKAAGAARGTFGRIVDSIVGAAPPGVSRPLDQGEIIRGEVTETGAKADELIKTSAAEQAARDLQTFNDGDQEQKNAIRDWAKQNGLSLKYSDLKRYYEDTARSALNQGYEAAYKLGERETDLKTEKENAIAGAAQPLQGLTSTQAQQVRQRAQSVGQSLNLPAAETQKLSGTAAKVANNTYLANKPAYVKGVAMTESAGNSGAVSSTGVKGIMQVTNTVASSYGLDRNDPEQNVQAGQFYLEDLFKQFDGEKDLAYAAYNAGPGIVEYAQKLAGGATDWETVREFMLESLKHFRKNLPKGVTPEEKYREVYNYPNKVKFNESLFTNA